MSETVPEAVRAFADGVLTTAEGETYEQTFGDAVKIPARFEEGSPAADWRIDGRIAVTVHRAGD